MRLSRSTFQWIFGAIFGPTPVQLNNNFLISAHSAYITCIESLGFMGLLIFVITYLNLIFSHSCKHSNQVLSRIFGLIFIVYSITYWLPASMFILVGMFTSISSNEKEHFDLERSSQGNHV